ncbi:MAG: PAS domain S-box protein [Thermoleophilia bacterium]|jgi:PAS domain S-box-containing protein
MSENKTKDPPGLADKLRRSEKEITLRNESADVFLTIPDDEMYNEVLKLVLPATESAFGAFGYLDENGDLVVPSMAGHIPSKYQVQKKNISFPRDAWGDNSWCRAIRERKAIYSNEPSTNMLGHHITNQRHISLPILFRGEVIGLFQIANKETDYNEADIQRLEIIAGFVAPELNARLQKERYEEQGQVAEENIRDREAKFRSIFEQAAIGIARMGVDGRWLEVNQRFSDIVGYTPQELMELTFRDITHPDDLKNDLEYVRRLISGEIDNYTMEKRYIRKDGSEIWINVTGSGVRKPSGEPEYFITTVEDISEKKRAQTELIQMSKVFMDGRNPIIIEDLSGNVLRINQEAERFYGFTSDELVGRPITAIVAPERHEQNWELREQCIRGGAVRNVEGISRDKSGRKIPVLQTLSLLKDEMGNPEAIASMAQDITELKLAEEQTQRVAVVEAANRELETFSYSISHDLRAPLRAIDGYSRIIVEDYRDRLDDEGKRLLDVVSDNARKMGELINDILELSRLSRQQLTPSVIDMKILAQSTFEELRAAAPEQKIVLKVENPPPARGDRVLIQQVMSNLLANAIKFTGNKATAVIEVGGHRENSECIYYVRDNGAGFDMQYADKLFGMFQRLHSEEEFEGTGIGLSIVQRIIHRHGGRVWAEGKVDKGATFYFTLPTER